MWLWDWRGHCRFPCIEIATLGRLCQVIFFASVSFLAITTQVRNVIVVFPARQNRMRNSTDISKKMGTIHRRREILSRPYQRGEGKSVQ